MAKWYQRTDSRRARGTVLPYLRGLLLVLLALVAIAISHRWILTTMARCLTADQTPVQADAIMVLGGGDGSRQDRAMELYEAGLAPTIISSGEAPYLPGFTKTFAELGAEYMVARGIAQEDILLINNSTSTQDEALYSRQLAGERGYETLLVVTDDYHMRRAAWTFRKAYRRVDIDLIFVAADPEWCDAEDWWLHERSLIAVVEEYEKMLFYMLKGYLI
jgi:uncharacterized SAM-binding protein YcdF (DUF218 family)